MEMINLFPVTFVKHLMVTHVRNTPNAWILFCKTWMTAKNCYYQKLLKAKLTTTKHVPSLIFLQRYVQPQEICTEHFKFSKIISLLHSSLLFVIYFPELYTSNLTVTISSTFSTGAVETVKLCISLFLLLANLYFQVVSFLVKTRLLLQLHFKLFLNLQ